MVQVTAKQRREGGGGQLGKKLDRRGPAKPFRGEVTVFDRSTSWDNIRDEGLCDDYESFGEMYGGDGYEDSADLTTGLTIKTGNPDGELD